MVEFSIKLIYNAVVVFYDVYKHFYLSDGSSSINSLITPGLVIIVRLNVIVKDHLKR